jgi:hypothetical protein
MRLSLWLGSADGTARRHEGRIAVIQHRHNVLLHGLHTLTQRMNSVHRTA